MDRKILALQLDEHDQLARLIYETIYKGYPAEVIKESWDSAQYAAPETTTGYTARMIQNVAHTIRARFVVTLL